MTVVASCVAGGGEATAGSAATAQGPADSHSRQRRGSMIVCGRKANVRSRMNGPLCRLCGAERNRFRVGDSAPCGRSERERFERQRRPGSQRQAIDYIITAGAAVVSLTDPAASGTIIRRPETRRRRRRRAGGCRFPMKARPAPARAAGGVVRSEHVAHRQSVNRLVLSRIRHRAVLEIVGVVVIVQSGVCQRH